MLKFKKGHVIAIAIVIVAMAVTIAGLATDLHYTKASLDSALADIEGMSFVDGKVVESKVGGIVTASLDKWVYSKGDEVILSPKNYEGLLGSILFELKEEGLLEGLSGNLVKLKYFKKVSVSSGTSEKEMEVFRVGDYYITRRTG